MSKVRNISITTAISEAIDVSMTKDKNLICYGLGTTDPKGIFGTTLNLEKKFGDQHAYRMTVWRSLLEPAMEKDMVAIMILLTHLCHL